MKKCGFSMGQMRYQPICGLTPYVFDIGPAEENGEIGYFKKNFSRWEKITEEEFWSAINKYESLPIELNWHELDGFWEPEEE